MNIKTSTSDLLRIGDRVSACGTIVLPPPAAAHDENHFVVPFDSGAKAWIHRATLSLVTPAFHVGDRIIERCGDGLDPPTLVYVGADGMVVNRAGKLEVVTGKVTRAPER